MKLIKLHTTESTNSFLKELIKNTTVNNYTVLVTDEQTFGRGQIAKKWLSEPFKNLTFSVFVACEDLRIQHQKYLNFAVTLAVFEVLNALKLPNLSIKWPNDILSEKQKLCGILIENQLKKDKINSSVIGIGLNVNQTEFKELPNATSIKNKLYKDFNLDNLLIKIINTLKEKMTLLNDRKFKVLEDAYLSNLYQYKTPSMFKDKKERLFMGKIIGISSEGKLQIERENESVSEFGIKEVCFVN